MVFIKTEAYRRDVLFLTFLLLVLATNVCSEIKVVQTLQIPGNGGANIDQAFTVSQSETVMVVGIYQDGDTAFNYVRFGDGGGVGTGDVDADLIFKDGRAAMAYFFNPSTAGGLSIQLDNGANGYVCAWVLTGVDVGQTPITDVDNSLTTTSANMMIVSFATKNAGAATITADNGSMSIDISLFDGGGTGTSIGGNLLAATAGAQDVGWNGDDEPYGPMSVAFFEAIVGAIGFTSEVVSDVTGTSANLTGQLQGTSSNVMVYWEAGAVSDPSSHVGWDGSGNIGGSSTGAVSYVTSSLVADTTYSFAFYGQNADFGTEGWSLTSGTFSTNLSAAQTPTFSSVSQVQGHLIVDLSWADNAITESSYRLQRAFDGGAFSDLVSLSTNTTSYRDTVPQVGDWQYRLSAVNNVNGSETDPAQCESSLSVSINYGTVKVLPVTLELGSGAISQAIQVDNESSILVIGMYGDAGAPVFNNVRFGDGGGIGSGDQAADGFVQDTRGAMAYFLNPSTSAGLSFRADVVGDTFIGAWELKRMDLTESPIISTSDSITTTDTGRFIVSWGWANGDMSSSLDISGSADLLLDIPASYSGGAGGTAAGASALVSTAGMYSTEWDNDAVSIGSPISMAFKRLSACGTIISIR
jgi:hypothetical protein